MTAIIIPFPAQRAAAVTRRKEIWEALHPGETGTNCSTLGGRGNTSFAAETAAVSGGSKQDINRHLARAESLGDDLEEERLVQQLKLIIIQRLQGQDE